MFDYTVFIGRFQPVHNGHLKVIKQALEKSDRLIILVGSANRASDIRNPFNYIERREMISLCLTDAERARIFFAPLNDYMYQDTAWVENVQRIVESIINPTGRNTAETNIALIGHAKDHTGFFLKLFPQWANIGVIDPENINATNIRHSIFTDEILDGVGEIASPIFPFLQNFYMSNKRTVLCREYAHMLKYKLQFAGLKYPPIHQTVDTLVEQSGHVLLVRRGGMPGEGLYALPGGFLNQTETLLDGAIRELREETKIDVPDKVLRGCVINQHTFDDPYRSTRGRTITNAYHIKLEDRATLPKVKGSDDAKDAIWVPWAQWKCEETFEDHWFIGQFFKK